MPKDPSLAAAILAGGRARRFGGVAKGALTLDGTSILERILAALDPVASHIFVVGRRDEAALQTGLPIVDDAVAGAGAIGGIYTAVTRSPCERTLVVGCDMPFITTGLVEHLAAVQEADLVLPRDAHGYQPLCAVYSRACAAPLRERIERGARHAAVPLAGVRVVEIGPDALAPLDPEGLLFVNVNTPHDYERARRIAEAGRAARTPETLSRLSHP